MSKIRYPSSRGHYEYFEHCPFCGSVEVDFDGKEFNCPDCGAVVSFKLPDPDYHVCDGSSDSEEILWKWNTRSEGEMTADDLCVMAQKADRETLVVYRSEIKEEVWPYILSSAKLGKFECEIPVKYVDDLEYYTKRKFDVSRNGSNYVISWKKDIQW